MAEYSKGRRSFETLMTLSEIIALVAPESLSKVLVMMIGLPASGKSTFSCELENSRNFMRLSADLVRKRLYGDEGIQGSNAEVFGEFDKDLEAAVASGSKIVIDNTNIKECYRELVRAKVVPFGYMVSHVFIDLPLAECLERNSKRERVVPEEIIREFYSDLMRNEWPTAEKGPLTIVRRSDKEGIYRVWHKF